ncbi:31414_t:CDS:2 [Gigaspora margarita]|uniref:31414_t:CDS:1 n=1 Tax=Gigaspora margarita TaxID=4874 RepID=A0ABN7VQN8_GIGMA|nr:31414_t:CDS:2 [Gigaspora margarita]
MSEIKKCMECKTTKSQQFYSLAGKKWEEAEAAENQLRKAKRVKVSIEDKIKESVELRDIETTMRKDIEAIDEEVSMINLVEVIRSMAQIFYEREHTRKEGPIYLFDEMRELLSQINPTYYLDSVGTSNEGLNMLANIGITTIVRMVDPIPRNRALNPKIVDDKLIMKHLDERFMVNLRVFYYDRVKGKGSNNDLIEKLILYSYDDRLAEKKSDKYIQNAILFDFVESNLKSVENYIKALQIVHDQEPMGEYLSNHVIPIVADWPGQFFIRKAIAHRVLLNNEDIPQFVTAFLSMMGPLHISLNSRKLVFDKYLLFFNDIYKGIFGKNKVFCKTPRPWRIDLILYIMRMAWLDIVDFVYLKFGNGCKNIEFLYLTNLLSNLIPLVLDIYAVHHREGNWPAYEEACMHC